MSSESIFNAKDAIIPMAEVSHILTPNDECAIIVFKHSRPDHEGQPAPSVHLFTEERASFLFAWCRYRHEIEG